MLYIGAFVLIGAAFMIWREYASFLDLELSRCGAFLGALTDFREKMKCYLYTPREWAQGYECPILSECGFLERVRRGADFGSAYRESSGSLCLSANADGILESCFSVLGEGYLDTELEVVESAIDKLTKEEMRGKEEASRKRKVAGAFLGACATGIVILII